MPELRFVLRWPDGTRETCYSPSTVVRDHFDPGTLYSLADFLSRSRAALTAASDRVKAIYGTPCPRALGQLARIERATAGFSTDTQVLFESFKE
jgi:uncharacterized repeat protein (TIGR04042 family)